MIKSGLRSRTIVVTFVFLSGYLLAANSSLEKVRIDDDGHVHITTGDGGDVVPPYEKDQVRADSAKLSEDRQVAGWLVNYPNCCTSYPVSLTLILYRLGKPLLRLGNGMLICDWRFMDGGKKVAFATNTVHGDLAPHFELHDVKTGRLLSKWDGHLDENSPKWAQGLRN